MPRLLVEVHKAASDPGALTENQIDSLEERCRALKEELLAWQKEFDEHRADMQSDDLPFKEADVFLELAGSGISMLAFASRLVSAVSPVDRISEEQNAVRYSKLMRQSLEKITEKKKHASFYLEQKIVVADSILTTTHIWSRGLGEEEPPRNRLIEEWKMKAWIDGIPDDYGSASYHSEDFLPLSAANFPDSNTTRGWDIGRRAHSGTS